MTPITSWTLARGLCSVEGPTVGPDGWVLNVCSISRPNENWPTRGGDITATHRDSPLQTSVVLNTSTPEISGIPAALANAHALRVYVCNLMTQANESLGLTASEHIERIYEHTRAPIFDFALINTAAFSPETLARYAAEGASPIVADIERIQSMGVRCIAGDFASEDTVVRHAPARVTGALLALGRTVPKVL